MADAAVEFLLNNLKDLLLHHAHLISDTKVQIESLERELRLFKAFLKDSVKKRRKDERTQVLVQNMRDVVYEVEDVIDAFVTQATENSTKSYFHRAFKTPVNLLTIAQKVEAVNKQVEQSKSHFASLSVADEDKSETPQSRPPRQKDVVGFVDVKEELIHRLTTETMYFDIISLIGMFGLGKTTLAWRIFQDPVIFYEFPIRIWLPISQEFSKKDVFLYILKQLNITLTKDLREADDHELARRVADELKTKKFLIILDDVWSTADWDRLSIALPNDNNMGKVLITSRIEAVGTYASRPRPFHSLRFFTQDESWELLRLEALGELKCPPDLEGFGHLIAKDCKGLPLAIVVIGGILATKLSPSNLSATRKAWELLSTQVSKHFNEDPGDRMEKFISLSYNVLPYHLRACFLYLGIFPEDYEIPAWKLILMWIGEGFIQQNNEDSLEETAEKYLEDLINRNLVRIVKIKPDGKVKTCRIHDSLRDFCRTVAGSERENFHQEIKSKNGVFVPPISGVRTYRRLSVHSNCLNFISSKPFGPLVRSFVCFSKDEFILPQAQSSAIPTAFKLLRVLDVKPIKFTKIQSDMYQLVHVRYIAFSFNLSILPANFSHLWNIQTLVVDTSSRTLEVKADLWKMIHLRHFKTNASATLPKPSKNSKHGENLLTLGTVSAESCTAELFERACNLKKLGIRGRLASLLEGKAGSFDSLGKMKNLEKLKLINDVYPSPPSDCPLQGLPQPYQFPSKLRNLALSATFLTWSNMSTLGLLENLEVLKLKDNAFTGKMWESVDGGFRRLEFLQMEHADLVVWKASSHHFPRLRGLVLRNCEELLGIPEELADIPSLQMVELYICRSAAASARKIEAKKEKLAAEGSPFNLSIYPPNE